MKKEIKDYLHLYISSEVGIFDNINEMVERGILAGVTSSQVEEGEVVAIIDCGGKYMECYAVDIKPMLRPLTDMTEEESIELEKYPMAYDTMQRWFTSVQFLYLLSKQFDLFGLIESGLAINKTTEKNEGQPQYPSKENGFNRGLGKGSFEFFNKDAPKENITERQELINRIQQLQNENKDLSILYDAAKEKVYRYENLNEITKGSK